MKIFDHKILSLESNFDIVSKGLNLYIYYENIDKYEYICSIPTKIIYIYLAKIRLLQRLLRLDIFHLINLDEKYKYLVFSRKNIYLLDIKTKSISLSMKLSRGTRPLYVTKINGSTKYVDGVYFGEYFENTNLSSLSIFRYTTNCQWESFKVFEEGYCNHIHNLVYDFKRDTIYVLTGDNDSGSGIHELNQDFTLSILFSGSQQYRSTWLFQSENNFYFGTDSQSIPNKVYKFSSDSDFINYEVSNLYGSTVYSCIQGKTIFFSTAVESIKSSKYSLKSWYDRKIPAGICGPFSILYSFNELSGLAEIMQLEKDNLPATLFGFGTFIFPSGNSVKNNKLYCYVTGLKNLDNKSLKINLM